MVLILRLNKIALAQGYPLEGSSSASGWTASPTLVSYYSDFYAEFSILTKISRPSVFRPTAMTVGYGF